MIDFLSTRSNCDTETAACARLIAAIIAQAIRDASSQITKHEKKTKQNAKGDAKEAIHFIFGRNGFFEIYSKIIGIDPQAIRDALLNKITDIPIHNGPQRIFTDMNRLNIQRRYRMEFLS